MRRSVITAALALCAALLSACNLTVPEPTIIPTPDLPQVSFQAPENNTQVFENFDLTVDIVARDTTAGIARIEFYVDGNLHQEGRPPDEGVVEVFRVNMNWITEGPGLHTLSAIAYRPDDTPSDEAIIAVEVLSRGETTSENDTPDAGTPGATPRAEITPTGG